MKYLNLFLISTLFIGGNPDSFGQTRKPNVLFIAIDDLRPRIGAYGYPEVKSPNMDKIAAGGTLFTKAYCQQALCSPSRTSLLTGLHPDVTGITTIGPHFRDSVPNVITLPEYFRQNGYFTQAFGKIYHGGLDDPRSWSVPHDPGKNPRYAPEGQAIVQEIRKEKIRQGLDLKSKKNKVQGPPFESYDTTDDYFLDGGNTQSALNALDKLKDSTFFLAVGFANPHIPYISPKKYWDLYDESKIILPDNQFAPDGSPSWALQGLQELYGYYNIPKPLNDDFKRKLIHGYLAATSYVDAQIGLLVQRLDELKLLDNTIIVIFGDHGYQLGEHGMWSSKHTNFETSTKSLLIVRSPYGKAKGQKSPSLVQFLDVYPTLADIAGLPKPKGIQGKSFKELLDNPSKKIDPYAFSQYEKSGHWGHTVTDGRYRLVQWQDGSKTVFELYDHLSDPEENKNIAAQESSRKIVQRLSAKINQHIEEDKLLKSNIGHTGLYAQH